MGESFVDKHHKDFLALEGKKYDPGQPRVPAGSSEGGRWTSGGTTAGGQVSPENWTGTGPSRLDLPVVGKIRESPKTVGSALGKLMASPGNVSGRQIADAYRKVGETLGKLVTPSTAGNTVRRGDYFVTVGKTTPELRFGRITSKKKTGDITTSFSYDDLTTGRQDVFEFTSGDIVMWRIPEPGMK